MKALAIRNHFHALIDDLDPKQTVDQIIVGDPEKEIRRIVVTWMPSFDALRKAVDRGYDMMVTHEPTFWDHIHDRENAAKSDLGRAKHEFIETSGLVVLRIHDVWDRMPRIGIPWAWAQFLDLGSEPAAMTNGNMLHRYDIEPVRFSELAARIAARTARIGEPQVQAVGDPDCLVSKVGVGTGCACGIDRYRSMGCDVSIVCDDGSCYWANLQHAADEGHPFIRVNHGTSEEPGMVSLTQYINGHIPGVTAEHLPHGCCFRLEPAG